MSSSNPIFLGIDIGTSSVKAGFVSADGRGLAQACAEYPTFYGSEGQVEQDAWDWWNTTTRAVQALVELAPQYAPLVHALSISCQAPTLFGVDRYGQPVGRGLIWMDRRAEQVCEQVLRQHEDYIHQYSCNRIDPYYMLSKLAWQQKCCPQAYAQTAHYLQINSWIVYLLTGSLMIDITNANLTQFMNVHTLNWDTEIFARLGLDPGKMPPVVPCSQQAGTIRPELARLWRLPEHVLVAAGCVDGSAVPLGLGLQNDGDVFEMSGTSSGIGVLTASPQFCPNLSLMKQVQAEKWFLKGSTSCSGGSLKWYRDQIDQRDDPASFQEYSRLAQASPPGANGVLFLPYLNGERAPLWDSTLRGVCLGFSSATKKEDMLRAIMEGTAYALRTIWEEFPPQNTLAPVILGSGGGYNSSLWAQIKADVLGRPIRAKTTSFDAAVLGSSYVAMQAAGFSIPVQPEDETEHIYYPDPALAALYAHQYKRFRRAYEATRDLFQEEAAPCY